MLNTLKATLLPSGMLSFEEEVALDRPIAVLVTLLEGPAPVPANSAENPLDWQLSGDEYAVWEDFPEFRAAHPVRFASLKGD